MIVTTPARRAATHGVGPEGDGPRWQSLAGRAMLRSECESIEHWALDAHQALPLTPDHGVDEALVVLSGSVTVEGDDAAGVTAGAGGCVLLPHGTGGLVRAGGDGAAFISVRVLPDHISRALPPRLPQLAP
ncbi:hypothetical protein ABZ442_27250 [Streptomyces triculaminicus]|uniref:hypothetical protein n=1 Tax=Streptomyces triculaminicus TaxID=2816232 RepID=UPI0033C1C597